MKGVDILALALRRRIYFGMGGLTMNLPDLIIMQWLLVRYAPPDASRHLVPAFVCGLAILLGRGMEGGSNPFIGHYSDICQSRWGRRIPFMRFGIVPFVLVFFLLFMPPIPEMSWINVVYLLALTQVYFLLYGIIVTPYLALLPEIASDLKGRVDLTTSQSIFIMVGTIVFASLGLVLERWGWAALAGSAATLILVFFIPVSFWVPEKPQPATGTQDRLGLWPSLWITLRNRPFRYVLISTSLYWFGLNGVLALVPFWVLTCLGGTEGDVALLMLPFLAVNFIFFFVFNFLAPRIGKYHLMLATFLGSGVAMAAFCLVGYIPIGSDFLQTAVVISLFGAPAAGFMILPFAILADVVDYDALQTGRRREAVFLGVQGVFQKLLIGVSALAFTIVPYLGASNDPASIRNLTQDGMLVFQGVYTQAEQAAAAPPRPFTEHIPDRIVIACHPPELSPAWTLTGPGGFRLEGRGEVALDNMTPGRYTVLWDEVPGWNPPPPERATTPFGLKLMALLCGLACFGAFAGFLGYPIRDSAEGAVVLE
jgi:glycoside/pentoside/hexuronide:cation symporter, GPH family